MSHAFGVLAVALFATASAWTGLRARTGADAALPLGLGFVALASAFRVPAAAELLKTWAPAGTHEVAKHVALVTGCLFVGVWAYGATTGRAPRTRYVALAAVAVGAAMVAIAVVSGPWTTHDLDAQVRDRPLMWGYWALYYGTFVAATATFAVSCVRTRSQRPVRLRWGMDVAAAGAVVAVGWAVVSFVAMVQHEPGSTEPYLVLGLRTRYLVLAASVLLTVGIVGQLASSAAFARERRRDLGHLHAFLATAVGDGGLRGSSAAVDEYHRTIEILDGLAALALHSRRDDVDHVRVAVPGSPREVILAYQLQVAATRRGRGDAPSAEPDDWSGLLADDDALRRLGRALRDRTSREATVRVLEGV
ncbi:hypothetical protein [Cellulosimicrobium protaetiae]|uniref:Histidine kinase N-terminal 7TM region domain-containing protein n=1 Tax=Cellulosimicrobium protaetiae TaxID=2587808 RepID=A0A6M5UEI1_9MICO|nr:hypothetical protein [Cellulosimicrobium protaetiae]QJW36896.1 hypothetical protein FIC82_012545 [Cellulosimicrobium protaetiae]